MKKPDLEVEITDDSWCKIGQIFDGLEEEIKCSNCGAASSRTPLYLDFITEADDLRLAMGVTWGYVCSGCEGLSEPVAVVDVLQTEVERYYLFRDQREVKFNLTTPGLRSNLTVIGAL